MRITLLEYISNSHAFKIDPLNIVNYYFKKPNCYLNSHYTPKNKTHCERVQEKGIHALFTSPTFFTPLIIFKLNKPTSYILIMGKDSFYLSLSQYTFLGKTAIPKGLLSSFSFISFSMVSLH